MPIVNRLHNVIREDPALRSDIKVLGICVGNNQKQVDVCKSQFRVPYPLFPDERHDIHAALGGVGTPTTMVIGKDGKVLMTHSGVIKDFDKFLAEIRELHRKR
ncbi:MAG: redoxin domain-containing protein [Deltaproteobacteria bacterium]|nr:redoxin domain-containing protein [Deltaproteobacteria bacterium]